MGMTIQNTGAGHSFPTGNPFTTAQIDVVLVDSAGKDLAPAWTTTLTRVVEAAPPFRTVSDNRLVAGGQTSGTHRVTPSLKGAAGLGAVEVRLRLGDRKLVLERIPIDVR